MKTKHCKPKKAAHKPPSINQQVYHPVKRYGPTVMNPAEYKFILACQLNNLGKQSVSVVKLK